MSQEFKTNLVSLKLDYLCRIDFRQWVRKFMFVRFATDDKRLKGECHLVNETMW